MGELRAVDNSGFFWLFFRLTEYARRIFPASPRDVPHQADFPRVDFQALHIQARHRTTVNHLTAAQYAFERVTTKELLYGAAFTLTTIMP